MLLLAALSLDKEKFIKLQMLSVTILSLECDGSLKHKSVY